MTPTDTIKALRDALNDIFKRSMESNIAHIAKNALALTADASEDAPTSMDDLRKRLGDPLAICYRGMNFSVYRAEDVARVLARPVPVGAGMAADFDNALSAVLWLYHRLPRGYDRQSHIERVVMDLAQATGSDADFLLAELGREAAAPAAPVADAGGAVWRPRDIKECDACDGSGIVPLDEQAKPEAGQQAVAVGRKGCRDAFNLILNCRKLMAEKQMDKAANWVIACELFSVGSTTAMAICREADIDPQAYTMGKLAASATHKGEENGN